MRILFQSESELGHTSLILLTSYNSSRELRDRQPHLLAEVGTDLCKGSGEFI